MIYTNYDQYLLSDEWKEKSRKRAEIDNYRCCMCSSHGTMTNKLQTHHVTYRNLYHEDVYKDLLTLCENCHRAVHIMMNRVTDSKGKRGWKDSLTLSNHVIESEVK